MINLNPQENYLGLLQGQINTIVHEGLNSMAKLDEQRSLDE